MSSLSSWLRENRAEILELLSTRLRENKHLSNIAHVSAEEFFNAFLGSLNNENLIALQSVLQEWVFLNLEDQEEHPNQHMIMVLKIQADIAGQLGDDADLLLDLQRAFRPVILQLTKLEAMAHTKAVQSQLAHFKSNTARINKHKTDFISVASHELKTPLTLIEGYSNMLKVDFPETDYPRAASMIKGISSGTQRLREIIEDMIDTSILEMNLMSFNWQHYWIARILGIVTHDMGKIATERNISITFDKGGLPTEAMYGDPERIFQMFVKIVENAIKYTPDGGTIHISGKILDDDILEVRVQDSGIGMNIEDIEFIFEKFFSLGQVGLHSSSKTKFKGGGPGLGLAIAKGIVDAHQGTITVESEGYDEDNPRGSCFCVRLPMRHHDLTPLADRGVTELPAD